MNGHRYDRILASTALALILAAPIGAACAAPPRPPGDIAAPWWGRPAPTAAPRSTAPRRTITRSKAAPATAAPAAAAATATATTDAVATAPAQQPAAAPAAAAPAETPPAPKDTPKDAAAPAAPATPAVAAEPAAAPAPDPLASLDPADRPVAEKIRDLFAAKADKIFANKKEHTAVEAFYQNRNLAPLWLDKGVENARAKAVIARLGAADADGLEVKDYKTPSFAGLSPEALAEADLKLTQTVLTYARHVQAGRFPYNRVSNNNIELPQAPPDMAEVLSKIVDAADAAKALDEFSPPQPEYKKLKAVLAEMRGKAGGGTKEIPDGPLLKPAAGKAAPMEDARVPLLREKLGLTVTGDASDLKYDAKLAEAVKKYQKGVELPATGIVDTKTIKELNGPARDKQIDIVITNMERWRWYPRDLGKAHVIVNQPEFMLRVYHDGANVWTTRVVIGKPSMQTPLLTETMKYITINPTWNVPPSIVHNEYLPALQQDPTVLARMGLKVVTERDGSVHIYQPPGEANALGRIRFNFPNRFLVYQHDTPDKQYFNDTVRAQSHGCMRVQDPAKYAEVLFNIARPSENWTADKVKRMFGSAEQDIQLPVPIWVHLTYQTAMVDDAGKLQVFRDVYGLDGRTLAAIKSERGVVEPQQERKKDQEVASSGGQRRNMMPRTVSFFEGLFGGGRSFQPAPLPPRAIYRR
jgi:murein L,D-transpeptidase YcbB/YkuD